MKGKVTAIEYRISHDVCIQLMGPLLGMGYYLLPLTEALLSKGTNLTGTVWGNQKYLPKGVKELLKGDSIAYSKESLACVGWQDKKHVILLSTKVHQKWSLIQVNIIESISVQK